MTTAPHNDHSHCDVLGRRLVFFGGTHAHGVRRRADGHMLEVVTWNLLASDMAPRWTGRWGALATREPSGPNRAHEKSRRSLMLTLMLVRCNVRPICSAMPMNLQKRNGYALEES